jgi:predicted neutral ceramidase superfamily lipid hydrolase
MDLFDNPIVLTVALCFGAGLVAAAIARGLGARAAGLAPAAVFFTGYVATYQKIPPFPPVGSTNKVFYAALAAAIVGLVLDVVPRLRPLVRLLGPAAVVAIVLWIAVPRFAEPDADLYLTLAALCLGAGAALWRLATVADGAGRDVGAVPAIAVVFALALGLAPVALAGGSSSAMMLFAGLAAGLGAVGLVALAVPGAGFGAAGVLGAGGGLVAVAATVILISRQADPLALVLLLPVLVAGQIGGRFLPDRLSGRGRAIAVGVMTVLPLILVFAVLFLRHPDSFAL